MKKSKIPSLDFPNCSMPDYWDFLYFSFVIGMTSQISDVQVVSRRMRQLTLWHSVMSFFFNTAFGDEHQYHCRVDLNGINLLKIPIRYF
jgi:uncharacterized membrane protein